MNSPSFFTQPSGLTVGEIAALTGASPRPGARLDAVVKGIAAPDLARPTDIVFLDSEKHARPARRDAGRGLPHHREPRQARAREISPCW